MGFTFLLLITRMQLSTTFDLFFFDRQDKGSESVSALEVISLFLIFYDRISILS